MKTNALVALLIASAGFGSAAILIRFAPGVPPVSLALYRLALAGLIILTVDRIKRDHERLSRKDVVLLLSSASFLAFHLVAFIAAVKLTSVANATFLVNTCQVFVAVLSPILIKERIHRREIASIIAAISGIGLVSLIPGSRAMSSLVGDALAVLAAVLASFYTVIGRQLRQRMTTTHYVSSIYLMAIIPLLPLAIALEFPETGLHYSKTDVSAIFALVLIPTILGHGLYNYSLRYVKAITANIFALLEPVLASIFAAILFAERPTGLQVMGYSLIAIALLNSALGRR